MKQKQEKITTEQWREWLTEIAEELELTPPTEVEELDFDE